MSHALSSSSRTALGFEEKRKKLVAAGKFDVALRTYSQQKVFLPDENTTQFWDELFDGKADAHPMADWRINTVISQLQPTAKILNLGIGSGALEKKFFALHPHPKKYVGTDITQKTLRKLKKELPQVQLVKTLLFPLPFPAASFDIVLLLEVLEHIKPSETFRVLQEVYRVLRPGGTFVISVPVNEGLEKILPVNPNSHMRLYSEALLKFEVTTVGFHVTKVFRASAFRKFFEIKHALNHFVHFAEPNNIILVCEKGK